MHLIYLRHSFKKMTNFSEYRFQLKTYVGALLVFSTAALCFSIYESLSYSLSGWLIVGIGSSIGLFLNQYQIKIPQTNIRLSLRIPLILLVVIWLGVGGGVLLAIISTLGNYWSRSKGVFESVFDTTAVSVTTFLSAGTFYVFLKYVCECGSYPVAENPTGPFWLLSGMMVLGTIQLLLYSILSSIFYRAGNHVSVLELWRKNFVWMGISSIIGVLSVFAFHYLIAYFGLALGILVLPITIIGHLSYRFHKQMLTQKTREIREASRIHLATVEALATAIDARDQVGRGHVKRTQIFAVGIGKALNLPSDEIKALSTGALLHDIGKLAVPDHILNKTGKLTAPEMEKMKIHPEVGAAILEKVNFSYPVIKTVRFHHETWEGTGYPEGLKKEDIPLTARILAVANAYDSLRSARPYRPSVSREDARKFLLRSAGTQFDPRIVDVFMRSLTRFETEIKDKDLLYDHDSEAQKTSGEEIDISKISYVEQIKRANREVSTLYELARAFSSSLNLEEAFSLFVKKISELVPLDTCVIYLLDENQNVAIARYAEGKHSNDLKNRKIKVGQGATGYTLKKQYPIYHLNPGLDFSFYNMEFIQEYTSMASLPLIANNKLLGAVSLYSCELDTYEDEHMRLLGTLSRIASDAISKYLRHAETENKALTDPMTSLPNARSLQVQFEKEIARAHRNGSSFQILMLDLDGFKTVNDTFGHKAGDKLLKDISTLMCQQLRDYDFLARYAGDEFVAIIPETNKEAVAELCSRIENAVRNYKLEFGEGRFASVGVSLGAATYPNAGKTLDQLIIAADKAMYVIKGRKARLRQKKKDEIESRRKPEELKNSAASDRDSFILELDETHVMPSEETS